MLNFTNAEDHLVGIKSKMFWSISHLKPPITRLHSDRWNMVENYIHMKQKPHKSSEKQRFKKKKKNLTQYAKLQLLQDLKEVIVNNRTNKIFYAKNNPW